MNNKEIVAKALHDVLNDYWKILNLSIMEMWLFQPFH